MKGAGARALKKQMAKMEAAGGGAKMGRKKAVHSNKGEFLDRKKQRFEMSMSNSMSDGDFEDKKVDVLNPKF